MVAKYHCVKSVHIRSFSGLHFLAFGLNTEYPEYLLVFSRNAGKYGPEKLRIRTLFKQCMSLHNQLVMSMDVYQMSVLLTCKENVLLESMKNVK